MAAQAGLTCTAPPPTHPPTPGQVLYEEEARQLAATYEQQFHYGTFYAYMRLR